MIKLGNGGLNAIYPVGSIYMSVNSTNPSQLFGGTWELLKTFTGGELLAYGIINSIGTGTKMAIDEVKAISDSNFPNKTANITNYVDGVLSFESGAFKINKTNIIGFVEVETTVNGDVRDNVTGIYFKNNANELPSGVTYMKNIYGCIINIYGYYGGCTNTSVYKVDTETDTPFYANPNFSPYTCFSPYVGSFTPNAGGLSSYQIIKVYAKKQLTYLWKRTA